LLVVKDLITKILVPLDGSDQSKHALDYAVNLAVQTSAQIQLITVVPPVFLPTYSIHVLKSTAVSNCEEQLKISFKGILTKALSYVEQQNTNLKVSTKFVTGEPYEQIVKAAKEGDFDLIIMGSRGLDGQISFPGSVSSKVINQALCPVLIVKQKYVRSARRKAKVKKIVKK
jgi:nucleotide-binding universal stress UspA family protein